MWLLHQTLVSVNVFLLLFISFKVVFIPLESSFLMKTCADGINYRASGARAAKAFPKPAKHHFYHFIMVLIQFGWRILCWFFFNVPPSIWSLLSLVHINFQRIIMSKWQMLMREGQTFNLTLTTLARFSLPQVMSSTATYGWIMWLFIHS